MKRVLTRWDSMAISIGGVIGIGIFRVPADIAKYLPNGGLVVLLAWLVGGLISFMGALCYAELSAAFPETGGDYVFLRKGYGKLIAFLYAWTELVIIRTGSIAAISFLFADYACGFFSIDKSTAKLVAISVILLLTILNLAGLNFARKVQNIFTLAKVATLVLLIFSGLISAKGDTSRITTIPHITLSLSSFSYFALALIPILWTYGGWQENTLVAGETRDATRSLPFALLGTIMVTSFIYILLNALFLYTIPPERIASSPLIAADVLNILYGRASSKLIEALVVLYSIGSINVLLITGSRITYAMAGDIPMFRLFAVTSSKNMTPIAALLLNAIGACIFVVLGSFDRLLFFTGIFVWLFFALVVSTVFIFRRQYPENIREFIVPYYPWLPGCFVFICIALCLNTFLMYSKQSLFGIILVMTGVPIFYLSKYLVSKGFFRQEGQST